jgi:hypothetical protein
MMTVQKSAGVAGAASDSVDAPDCVDVKAFKPTKRDAELKLRFMLQRGAVLIAASERQVKISHSGRTARIDCVGRVRWDV